MIGLGHDATGRRDVHDHRQVTGRDQVVPCPVPLRAIPMPCSASATRTRQGRGDARLTGSHGRESPDRRRSPRDTQRERPRSNCCLVPPGARVHRGQARDHERLDKAMLTRDGVLVTFVAHGPVAVAGPFDERRCGLDHLSFAVATGGRWTPGSPGSMRSGSLTDGSRPTSPGTWWLSETPTTSPWSSTPDPEDHQPANPC